MLCILFGLGGTLVLLAVHGKALPGKFDRLSMIGFICRIDLSSLWIALPISIFLAVLAFTLTVYLMEPYIKEVFLAPLYV